MADNKPNDSYENFLKKVKDDFDAASEAEKNLSTLINEAKQLKEQQTKSNGNNSISQEQIDNINYKIDELISANASMMKQREQTKVLFNEVIESNQKAYVEFQICNDRQYNHIDKMNETMGFLCTKVSMIDNLIKPIAIIVFALAILFAIQSIKGCNIIPQPVPPIPSPDNDDNNNGDDVKPNPIVDSELNKALSICVEASQLDSGRSRTQKVVWATQELVRQLNWSTEKSYEFANEHVI